ncbi:MULTISPECIES: TrkA family potassium uptake protein [Paenibacillus]|uniref:TrkA family potassium uptake protein n=1 Tax=Paenibacillus baimaensis TaxID=2982185 RepID=A0ABT2UQ23_9BACL|nr:MULTISPECIES: TrkA family potassium uptake protein [unclassified Paenibacillus]MCU6796759.1 TrkA family potassium uptake protein [Paenibacillus sp. WQ 127069]OMF14928.1 potassium uptake system protein [Paenibacillus sp. FSL H7-0331]
MKRTQYAVIGLGRFGSSLARELTKLGHEVLGIDQDEEAVDEMSEVLTHVVVADSTDEEVLRSLGIRNFDCVIVAIGSDIQSSILTAILLKDIGVPLVVTKALSELHGKVLNKIGVDRVIFPERDMGIRVAHQLVSPNLLDFIELSRDYTIAELSVPKRMSGRTLKDLNLRVKYGCSVVAINKKEGVIIAPTANDLLEERDILVIIGTNSQIESFENEVVK